MIGLSATGATISSFPATRSFSFGKNVSPLVAGCTAGADRGRPFVDLAADEISEISGAALAWGHHIEAEVLELAAHRGLIDHLGQRRIELGDKLRRRALGQEHR